jgi:amino acid transporter
MAGWTSLACATISLASVALALQGVLPAIAPWTQVVGRATDPVDASRNAVLLGGLLVVASTAINVLGVRLLARINNIVAFAELAGAVTLIALLTWQARRGLGVVLETQGRGEGLPASTRPGPSPRRPTTLAATGLGRSSAAWRRSAWPGPS